MFKKLFVLLFSSFILSGCVAIVDVEETANTFVTSTVNANYMGVDAMYRLLTEGKLEVEEINNYHFDESGILRFAINDQIFFQSQLYDNKVRFEIISETPLDDELLLTLIKVFVTEDTDELEKAIEQTIDTKEKQEFNVTNSYTQLSTQLSGWADMVDEKLNIVLELQWNVF
jgi:hypothetical protein